MFRLLSIPCVILAAATLLLVSEPDAEGCASVPRMNGPSISIAEESAIIVWDPVKKIQHFIRRAAFDTKSPDFGFLVPTPTTPKLPLETVEDGIFSAMDQWMLPKTVEQTRLKFDPMFCMFGCGAKAPPAEKSAVRVLHEQKVGGYEVNVLEADNADELSQWIKKHGYSADPELYEWLTPYVANKWKITAFKITQDPTTGKRATTKAVRMSFQTERPFFPYREPEGKALDDFRGEDGRFRDRRLLRVLFVSGVRMEGQLGTKAWHASVPWSNELTDEQRQQIVKETGVPADEIPANAWLTTFEDRSSPRPGKDEVYFDPSPDRTPIVPPPFIRYSNVWIPVDCALIGTVFVLPVLWRFAARRMRKKPAEQP